MNDQSLPLPSPDAHALHSDPLAPDAPILSLLTLSTNPLLKDMSVDQLKELLAQTKTLAQQPASLSAKLSAESARVKPVSKTAKLKAVLDTL